MSFKSSSLLCIALLLACSSAVYGFNITELLEKNPEFSQLNRFITEAKLADEINRRNTITVLAVENGAISSISGKSQDFIKAVVSTHVILDYFDQKKLMEVQGNGTLLTTLYQSSGLARNQQGFLNVSLIGEGEIAFSAAGSSDYAELVKTVLTEPYNISILQITKVIIPVGLDSQTPVAQSPQEANKPSPPPPSANAPAPSETAEAPTAEAPTDEAPTPSESLSAPPPGDEPADSPSDAADSPTADADGPEAADAAPSSSSTIQMGFLGAVMAFASLFIVL